MLPEPMRVYPWKPGIFGEISRRCDLFLSRAAFGPDILAMPSTCPGCRGAWRFCKGSRKQTVLEMRWAAWTTGHSFGSRRGTMLENGGSFLEKSGGVRMENLWGWVRLLLGARFLAISFSEGDESVFASRSSGHVRLQQGGS